MAESIPVMKVITGSKDATHNAFKTVEIEHAEIHSGNGYTATRSTTVLGASSWIDIQINTGTVKGIHAKNYYLNNSAGLAQFEILELSTGSTFTTGSASLTTHNRFRGSTKVTDVVLFSDPSNVGSTEIAIEDLFMGSSALSGLRLVSANLDNDIEMILKTNSTYIFRLTNLTTSAGYASMRLFWYEDTL